MKVLLIKPWAMVPTYFPPLGLAYIGAVLEKAGHSVKILDLTIEGMAPNKFRPYLLEHKPDVVGITCMVTEFNEASKTSSICKEVAPRVPVIVGGPLPSALPRSFLAQPSIDIVVRGEAEATITELLRRLESGTSLADVPGVGYKDNGEMRVNPAGPPILDMDTIPFPARHLLPMERYFSSFENWFGRGYGIKGTNMFSSRGCPYSCIYCDKNVFGAKWRGRSAGNIMAEIEILVREYGVNGILFSDDMFDLYPARVYQICDEIKSRGLDIVWGINSRVNHADEEMYRRMKESGCQCVAFGIESGNQNTLDFMRKKITLQQITEAIDIANRAGLKTVGYFMIGMLGENRDTIKQTVKFARGLGLDSGGFSRVVPYPGTTLYRLVEEQGFIRSADTAAVREETGAGVSLTPDFTPAQLDRIVEKAYWQFFWSRPSRKLPGLVCSFISALFPIAYALSLRKMNLFIHLNRLREALRLPLP
ncbi:MAG: hypothetical protein A2144_03815 [Chloroflexi bacterium RBG_16_50_9]|nr:MAG: hypothetical protein A2144_03815 [Chloroflexi bacterium RBG_16_50_9]